MKILLPFLTLMLCFGLIACGSNNRTTVDGLTPLPPGTKQISPPDSKLVEAINSFLKQRGAPPNSEYDFSRVDLNRDGLHEGLVLFKLPHTYWCGWDGCGMAIFQAKTHSFAPLSTISNVRGPIYVDTTSTRGWRNIIVRVSGTNMPDKNVILSFDGRGYPQSPMLARTLDGPLPVAEAMKIFR